MTDREKAIIMAYTGICMLTGDKLREYYSYLEELYGRPVYTHELITLDIQKKSKKDFLELCQNTSGKEVIRCKDCEHSRTIPAKLCNTDGDWMVCNFHGRAVVEDDFCSWEKRRKKKNGFN